MDGHQVTMWVILDFGIWVIFSKEKMALLKKRGTRRKIGKIWLIFEMHLASEIGAIILNVKVRLHLRISCAILH